MFKEFLKTTERIVCRRHQPSREEVLALVHLPIHKAALKLGMKATAFKKLCRNHKIHRWPHRQYQSLNSLSCQLQAQVGSPFSVWHPQVLLVLSTGLIYPYLSYIQKQALRKLQGSNLVDTLESGKAAILYYGQTPNYVRLQSYRKLRQHSYRLKYPEATSTCTSS